jgi:hypothetical protein
MHDLHDSVYTVQHWLATQLSPRLAERFWRWMVVATALVLLMTPALAFFYGGLVRSKNALNTMMMSFVALGVVGVCWALVGYSLAFAEGNAGRRRAGVRLSEWNVGLEEQGTIPHVLFMAFQGTFAIITAALISGAIVERMRFTPTSPSSRSGRSGGLRAGGPLGVGRRLAGGDGRARLRRRHRGARQRRRRGARGGDRARPAEGLRSAGHPAAQRAVHAARRRAAVVRLVRLQRRQRARRERIGGARLRDDLPRAHGRRWSSGRCST